MADLTPIGARPHRPPELVHSSPLPGEGRYEDQWHRDLAALVRLLRGVMAEDTARFKQACSPRAA